MHKDHSRQHSTNKRDREEVAVASGDPAKVVHFNVRKEGEPPLLRRIWPAEDAPDSFGIYCSDAELPDLEIETKAIHPKLRKAGKGAA